MRITNPNSDGQGQTTSLLRVLVVEDDLDTTTSLQWLTKRWGYPIQVCLTPAEALRLYPTYQPHVVFLDIGLPEMDGCELAHRLVAETAVPRPVLVAITGYDRDEDRRRYTSAGFDYLFVKPANPNHLREVLDAEDDRLVTGVTPGLSRVATSARFTR
jgi:CheY-like chemotaxis protein